MSENMQLIPDITDQFCLDTPAVSCQPYGNGNINKTYMVTTRSGSRYILQQLSEAAFGDIPALMENIRKVTSFLGNQGEKAQVVILPVATKDGGIYIRTAEGYFRMTPYAENTMALETPESPEDFYKAAKGFGSFVHALKDFPADTLVETIPNFHNTVDRYRLFHEALAADKAGRAATVQEEIRFFLDREEEMGTLEQCRRSGALPVRVTHNDTKLNNILFDQATREPKYVIDLDTVMPGLSLYDYGDCVRCGACTAAEDEPDTSKIDIDLEMFRVFTRGYLEACLDLTDKEIELMPLGAKTITLELAMRFLTDYLNGDTYFNIKYADHNLVRARAQIKMASSIEENWDEMQSIVADERSRI